MGTNWNTESQRLNVQAQLQRTRDEQLAVINRRMNAMESAIVTVTNAVTQLSNEYERLGSDIHFYTSKWGEDPTVPPSMPKKSRKER